MKTLITFSVLVLIKLFGKAFYQIRTTWLDETRINTKRLKLIILLNHTSLFEPIYLAVLPLSVLWKIARSGVLPGADITMSRPIMGWFFRLVTPSTIPISRRRDKTWRDFLARIEEGSIILIAPEGRMKRPGGLDKQGNPMTVRGGISDVFEQTHQGQILFAYSGGLHHIMTPDEKLPRLFKPIRIALEAIEIDTYKTALGFGRDPRLLRIEVAKDLEKRRDNHCIPLEKELERTCLAPVEVPSH